MKINEMVLTEYCKVADLIRTHASQWLSLTQNGKLKAYRGSRLAHATEINGVSPRTAFTKPIHTERERRDTDQMRHNAFNAIIKAAGGTANRSNSAFVSGHADKAAEFGEAFVFIPLGNFRYTWSPNYRDWTEDFTRESIYSLIKFEYVPPQIAARVEEAYKLELESFASDSTTSNFLKQTYEKLLTPEGKEAWVRRRMAWQITLLPESSTGLNLSDPRTYDKATAKNRITVDAGLAEAINKGDELMISASEGLYIAPHLYNSILSFL